MSRTIRVFLLLLGVAACDRAAPDGEHDEPDHDDHHIDEPAHEARPRRVELSEVVIRDAGIETEAVATHVIARTVQLPGEIVVDPDRNARVGARLAGIVESVSVRPGDAVAEGDVLATIRAPGLQALRASEAALRARAASARANAERLKTLAEKRMASQQEVTSAKADADALAAEAHAARERLRAIGVGRSHRGPILFQVRSPITGVVTERSVVAGDPVTETSVLATVVSVEEVWFVGHIFERDVPNVREGSSAVVVLNAHPEEDFQGTVSSVAFEVDPGARTLSARIPLTNRKDQLRLGLFGTASVVIDGGERPPTLAVPRSAVTDVHGETAVFVQQSDGHFELHAVTLGNADTTRVEIVHGLRAGERVVTQGAFNVKSALLRDSFGEDHH